MDTNVYALIDPEGELYFRTGVPYAMWRDTDPHNGSHCGFTVIDAQHQTRTRGVRGYVGDVSALFPEMYLPNPIAQRVASELTQQQAIALFGKLTLCGCRYDDGEAEDVGLTEQQQEAIRAAHRVALADTDPAEAGLVGGPSRSPSV
ncbi:hypothetical protein [Streptomyces sp. SID12501]|uniref:Uncharacterized protein n=1 Tax=Streptomyces sp. SID12501 TaxID=2706042 RepID=A0A6B3BTY6_9ACTN|nr:hypothetical protein [Streptomyces sp. SID12501]NEC87825.1 hypothetical protein [Streptomyces sp. SID12501]